MRIIRSIPILGQELAKLRDRKRSIGFVPTMGCLHEGHASLLRRAKKENDIVVLSIFVNPSQFGPKEDFKKYPRTFKEDVRLAKKEGTDIIFSPTINEIYPQRMQTYVDVPELSNVLCGKTRPGHFRGVSTVVAKLLNIVWPNSLYLGEKDAQQVQVIKIMVANLNFPVRIKTCPTVREKNGLALSSRNKYLTEIEKKEAAVLYHSLQEARKKILAKEKNPKKVIEFISTMITKNSSGVIDYIACVDAEDLKELSIIQGKILLALAVKFGKARLIDNIIFKVS